MKKRHGAYLRRIQDTQLERLIEHVIRFYLPSTVSEQSAPNGLNIHLHTVNSAMEQTARKSSVSRVDSSVNGGTVSSSFVSRTSDIHLLDETPHSQTHQRNTPLQPREDHNEDIQDTNILEDEADLDDVVEDGRGTLLRELEERRANVSDPACGSLTTSTLPPLHRMNEFSHQDLQESDEYQGGDEDGSVGHKELDAVDGATDEDGPEIQRAGSVDSIDRLLRDDFGAGATDDEQEEHGLYSEEEQHDLGGVDEEDEHQVAQDGDEHETAEQAYEEDDFDSVTEEIEFGDDGDVNDLLNENDEKF
jgi:hypothetical protein